MLIIDIGNTHTKMLDKLKNRIKVFKTANLLLKYNLPNTIKSGQIIASSVLNLKNTNQILNIFKAPKCKIIILNSRQIFATLFSSDQIKQLNHIGTDRALKIFHLASLPQKNYLSIGCGTAFTLEVVHNHQFMDSYILPGIHAQYKLLTTSTDKIKMIDVEAPINHDKFYETNTSICNGIVLSYCGLVDKIVNKWKIQHIFISGYYHKLIYEYIKHHDYQIEMHDYFEIDIINQHHLSFTTGAINGNN